MSIKNDQKVPQPRYSQFNKDKAKEQGLALVMIDIDRRFMTEYDEGNAGGRVTVVGCCPREVYPYLHRAFLMLSGLTVEQTQENFDDDMKALAEVKCRELMEKARTGAIQGNFTEKPTALVD